MFYFPAYYKSVTDGRTDGWTDGWTDGRSNRHSYKQTDGQTKGRVYNISNVSLFLHYKCSIFPLFTKAYGWTDKPTNRSAKRRTHPLIEMLGRILKPLVFVHT